MARIQGGKKISSFIAWENLTLKVNKKLSKLKMGQFDWFWFTSNSVPGTTRAKPDEKAQYLVTKVHYWIYLRFCYFWSSSTFKIKDHAIPIVKSKRSDKKTCVKFHETNSKNTWAHTNGNALKWGTSYINWFFPNLLLCDTFL